MFQLNHNLQALECQHSTFKLHPSPHPLVRHPRRSHGRPSHDQGRGREAAQATHRDSAAPTHGWFMLQVARGRHARLEIDRCGGTARLADRWDRNRREARQLPAQCGGSDLRRREENRGKSAGIHPPAARCRNALCGAGWLHCFLIFLCSFSRRKMVRQAHHDVFLFFRWRGHPAATPLRLWATAGQVGGCRGSPVIMFCRIVVPEALEGTTMRHRAMGRGNMAVVRFFGSFLSGRQERTRRERLRIF